MVKINPLIDFDSLELDTSIALQVQLNILCNIVYILRCISDIQECL
jgi:hypothetical protein